MWGRIAILATVVFWAIYVVTTIIRQFIESSGGFRFTMEAVGYLIVVTFLTFSALMYLLARQGALYRFRAHVRVPRAELDRHFRDYDSAVTVLVPSYAEEPAVVRGTLWSAALQEFTNVRVVLLVDDSRTRRTRPPGPGWMRRWPCPLRSRRRWRGRGPGLPGRGRRSPPSARPASSSSGATSRTWPATMRPPRSGSRTWPRTSRWRTTSMSSSSTRC